MPEPYRNKYGEILPYDSFENEPTAPGLLPVHEPANPSPPSPRPRPSRKSIRPHPRPLAAANAAQQAPRGGNVLCETVSMHGARPFSWKPA